MRKTIKRIIEIFQGEIIAESTRPDDYFWKRTTEIDISEYTNYNYSNPPMCSICATQPAKYSVTTWEDGPKSHDYCRGCFTVGRK